MEVLQPLNRAGLPIRSALYLSSCRNSFVSFGNAMFSCFWLPGIMAGSLRPSKTA